MCSRVGLRLRLRLRRRRRLSLRAPISLLEIDRPQGRGALGHVGCVVAHALQVVGDLQGRQDLAQVVGHRLAQGQHAQGQSLDLVLQVVDVLVRLDAAGGQRIVALGDRLDGVGELSVRVLGAYSLDNDSALLIMDIAEGLSIAVPHLQVARLVAHTNTHSMEARVEARARAAASS